MIDQYAIGNGDIEGLFQAVHGYIHRHITQGKQLVGYALHLVAQDQAYREFIIGSLSRKLPSTDLEARGRSGMESRNPCLANSGWS